jgi:simple sugar transport system permease protein
MNDPLIVRIIGSIIAQSTPLMLAITGETITERSGVINLSLDGSMMLSAMVGFFVAYESSSLLGVPGDTLPVLLGFAAAAIVGAAAALLVAWGSIDLKQNQVAIGFVLTLLLADLANFLGQNHAHTGAVGAFLGHTDPEGPADSRADLFRSRPARLLCISGCRGYHLVAV